MHIAHYLTPYDSKCCTNLIKTLQIKNTFSIIKCIPLCSRETHLPFPQTNPEKPSSVKARSSTGVVHADLVSPVGEARLWFLGGSSDGLGVGVGGLEAGSRVAEVGGRP